MGVLRAADLGRSGHPEDLAHFERALPVLRDRWPDAGAILRSSTFEALAAGAGAQFAATLARATAAQKAVADHNARARALALHPSPCPHCGHTGPHRLVDAGDARAAYFICATCARSFGHG